MDVKDSASFYMRRETGPFGHRVTSSVNSVSYSFRRLLNLQIFDFLFHSITTQMLTCEHMDAPVLSSWT